MITIERLSIPVNFDLSFLKIRWSDHLLIKEGGKVVGEGVVYGGDWEKAEKLAQQMAEMKFGAQRSGLPVCEQVFIESAPAVRFPLPWSTSTRRGDATAGFGCDSYFLLKQKIGPIRKRGSNLKLKVGRNVIEDIKVIKFIRFNLKFPNQIRIDANQGYSLKQLQYLISTLKEAGIEYVEEPVKVKDLPAASEMLHRYGLKIILDESLNLTNIIGVIKFIDAVNLKLSRIGDINKSLQLIKLAKKHNLKVVIGCSEELDRGMEAIFKLGHEAKKAGVLLEVEGFGPLRLQHRSISVPRWINRLENLIIIIGHRVRQLIFGIYWFVLKFIVLIIKKSKLISSLSLHLVKWTGKSSQKIHPKHLIFQKYPPEFLKYLEFNDSVLDVGCGNGQNSLLAAGKVKQVIGFDIDKKQLKIAESEAARRGLANIRFDYVSAAEKLPYDSKQFDKVIFLGVLEHLSKRENILQEIKRVMKPEGKLLLGIPNEITGWKKLQMSVGIQHFTDPDHELEFTKRSISDLLVKTGFKVLSIEPTAFDTPWAGLIDVIGGISLNLYQKFLFWKWDEARKNPEESISFFIVANKS